METIEQATSEQLVTFNEISNMIFKGGYSAGHDDGYSQGINTYTFKRRFLYKTFEFGLGIVIGFVVAFLIFGIV